MTKTSPGKPQAFLEALEVEGDLELFNTWARVSALFRHEAREGFRGYAEEDYDTFFECAQRAVVHVSKGVLSRQALHAEALMVTLYRLRPLQEIEVGYTHRWQLTGLSEEANVAYEAFLRDPEGTDKRALEQLILANTRKTEWR